MSDIKKRGMKWAHAALAFLAAGTVAAAPSMTAEQFLQLASSCQAVLPMNPRDAAAFIMKHPTLLKEIEGLGNELLHQHGLAIEESVVREIDGGRRVSWVLLAREIEANRPSYALPRYSPLSGQSDFSCPHRIKSLRRPPPEDIFRLP